MCALFGVVPPLVLPAMYVLVGVVPSRCAAAWHVPVGACHPLVLPAMYVVIDVVPQPCVARYICAG